MFRTTEFGRAAAAKQNDIQDNGLGAPLALATSEADAEAERDLPSAPLKDTHGFDGYLASESETTAAGASNLTLKRGVDREDDRKDDRKATDPFVREDDDRPIPELEVEPTLPIFELEPMPGGSPIDDGLDLGADLLPAAIEGTADGDILFGTEADEEIMAAGGDDIVFGLGGDDTINGSYGSDTVDGGAGNDRIELYQGDTATGGEGSDTFTFHSTGDLPMMHTITDFNIAEDEIRFAWASSYFGETPDHLHNYVAAVQGEGGAYLYADTAFAAELLPIAFFEGVGAAELQAAIMAGDIVNP